MNQIEKAIFKPYIQIEWKGEIYRIYNVAVGNITLCKQQLTFFFFFFQKLRFTFYATLCINKLYKWRSKLFKKKNTINLCSFEIMVFGRATGYFRLIGF